MQPERYWGGMVIVCCWSSSFTRISMRPCSLPSLTDCLCLAAAAQASLGALEALIHKYGAVIGQSAIGTIVEEAAALITEQDKQQKNSVSMAAGSLRLFATILQQQPGSGAAVVSRALPPAMALLQSAALQGAVSEQLQHFFANLLQSGTPEVRLL